MGLYPPFLGSGHVRGAAGGSVGAARQAPMRSAGVHGGGSIMPLGLPFYLWPGSSWFAMSLTVDVFAYTLAGTLAVVDAVAFGQRPLYGRTCRSLAFIIARESYFV